MSDVTTRREMAAHTACQLWPAASRWRRSCWNVHLLALPALLSSAVPPPSRAAHAGAAQAALCLLIA
jgi:hypothetical protein